MGIESQRDGVVLEDESGDEVEFESRFTAAGVEAFDAAEDHDTERKINALQILEEMFTSRDIQSTRLPAEEEVFAAYQRLAEQLGREQKFRLNDNGDIESLAPSV